MFTKKQAITAIFGAKLRRIRQERRLSQKGLAEKIGVGETMIVDYEAGRKTPGIDKLVALSEALGAPVAKLLGVDDKTERELRFERCLRTAMMLGLSIANSGAEILIGRDEMYDESLSKDDFIYKMETLERYILAQPRVRKLAHDVLFDDDDDTE